MARAAEQAGVTTQVGFNYRHTPAVGFAKQIIDVGRIGHPTQVRASYTQESAFGADSKRWRASKVTGGSGAVGDIGSHIIDMTQLLFGDIVRVCGLLRSWAGDGGQGWLLESERLSKDLVDDAGVWLAEFANGAIGSFAVNFFSSGRKNRIHTEFDGTLGAIEFDWNAREEFRVSYVDEEPDHMGFRTIHTNDKHPNGWWRLAGLGTGYPDISAIQMQEFIRAILAGTPGTPDFAAAAQVQRVVEAIAASAVSGQWVEVDRN
jgi:predicted dehydrogenase